MLKSDVRVALAATICLVYTVSRTGIRSRVLWTWTSGNKGVHGNASVSMNMIDMLDVVVATKTETKTHAAAFAPCRARHRDIRIRKIAKTEKGQRKEKVIMGSASGLLIMRTLVPVHAHLTGVEGSTVIGTRTGTAAEIIKGADMNQPRNTMIVIATRIEIGKEDPGRGQRTASMTSLGRRGRTKKKSEVAAGGGRTRREMMNGAVC
jgi:hypothetical protein